MFQRLDQVMGLIDREAALGDGIPEDTTEDEFKLWGLVRGGAKTEMILDESYRQDGGEQGGYPGLAVVRNGGVGCKVWLTGLGAAVTTGAPDDNALTKLLEILFQADAAPIDGGVSGGTPTAIEIDVADAGSHDHTTDISIGQFELPTGRIEMTPYRESGTPDKLDLLMALSEVPDAADYCYGGWVLIWTVPTAAADLKSAGIRFLGKANNLHLDLLGAVASGKIPATDASKCPVLELDFNAADYSEPSDTIEDAGSAPAMVQAGGDLKFGGVGSTVVSRYMSSSTEVDFRGAFSWVPYDTADHGTGGFQRAPEMPRMKVTIPLIEVPPAACTGGTWKEIAESADIAANHFQAFWQKGTAAGKMTGIYWSDAIVIPNTWDWAEGPGGAAYQTFWIGSADGGEVYLRQG